MCRPWRRVPASFWALAAVVTLLSLLFAAPATADTVTPVRHCGHGDGYRELDGDPSVVVTAPEGYLIESYCVEGRGRRGSSEVRVLSTPQTTTVVRHSDGRPLEGYSVEYTRAPAPEEPEEETEEPTGEPGGSDGASQTAEAEAEQSDAAAPEETTTAGPGEKAGTGEKSERTPSAAATEPDPGPEGEPSRRASAETSAQPEDPSQMSALSDGEELRITSLEEEDDDEDLRSLMVAGGIIIVGLLAGMIALVVRLPGQR